MSEPKPIETIRAALKRYANPSCRQCRGAGTIFFKNGLTFETDTAEERRDAWHYQPCPTCANDSAEALAAMEQIVVEGKPMEARVAEWVRTRIGPDHMNSRERAMRLLEEAVELAQAEGIVEPLVVKQVAHVFARPAGAPEQEASGVAVCLFGWCAANGLRLRDIAEQELERIEKKPLDQIRGSLTRKTDADLVTLPAVGLEESR